MRSPSPACISGLAALLLSAGGPACGALMRLAPARLPAGAPPVQYIFSAAVDSAAPRLRPLPPAALSLDSLGPLSILRPRPWIVPEAASEAAAAPLPAHVFGALPLPSGSAQMLAAAYDKGRHEGSYSFWDNGRVGPEAAYAARRPSAALRIRSLSENIMQSETAKHAGRLDEILAAAADSPTAMKVLRAARGLARNRVIVPVRFKELGRSLGEYDYFKDVLYLGLPYLNGDPRDAVATVIHELVHILQHAQNIPAESLEMEMEAHIVTLKVMEELGVKPDAFSDLLTRELRKSPEAFVEFMRAQMPGKMYLEGEDFDDLRDMLEEDADHSTGKTRLKWIYRDLRILASRSGRMNYRRFCDRVHRLIRSHHQHLNQPT